MRRIVYGLSLWLFLAASICTILSIALPNWITYHSPASGSSSPITISYGLHKRCSSLTGTCTKFPSYNDCVGSEDRKFCSVWRSVGFAMNFSVVLELACAVAYVTVLVGGRRSREEGWKVLGGILGLVAVGEMVAMAFVVSGTARPCGRKRDADEAMAGISLRPRQTLLRRLGAG